MSDIKPPGFHHELISNHESPTTRPTTSDMPKLEPAQSPKMSSPTTLSEWQLLAVLQRANLVQYYEVFISKGGDDINQIMQCDEKEFLEIMSLVGMVTKPLHVRRLQRSLSEFSKDPAAFNLAAIQHIGAPPVSPYQINGTDPMSLLLPGITMTLNTLANSAETVNSDRSGSPGATSGPTTTNSVSLGIEFPVNLHEPIVQSDGHGLPSVPPQLQPRATANIVSGHNLGNTFGPYPQPSANSRNRTPNPGVVGSAHKEEEGPATAFLTAQNDFVSLGDFDPNNPTTENPVLSTSQINRLAECALTASKGLPELPPRLVQNKKRISKEVKDLLTPAPNTENRIAMFRRFSAIYGRFDTKRKPHKVLSLHETAVNEAAAQLCLLVPALLTRRDELFPLARQIVKDAGYQYAKSRKRPCDPADLHSPISTPSASPPPGLSEQGFELDQHKNEHDLQEMHAATAIALLSRTMQENHPTETSSNYLEQWASERMAQFQAKVVKYDNDDNK